MKIQELAILIKRSECQNRLIEWAGIFRYLGARSQKEGFTLEEWLTYNSEKLDHGVAQSLFRLLEESLIISKISNKFYILEEHLLQRLLESLDILFREDLLKIGNKSEKLLWTLPNGRIVPKNISSSFVHLNSWIRQLILTSEDRLIFFSPYFSEAGINHLIISLEALILNKTNIKIDWITSDLSITTNQKAFLFLKSRFQSKPNFRFFEAKSVENERLWFHAKLLLVDSQRGYLGSANFSKGGLDEQFEYVSRSATYPIIN